LVFGNKLNDGEVVLSNGMLEEYEISKKKNNIVLPVGATGYMAKELWEKEYQSLSASENTDESFLNLFYELGDETKSPEKILSAIQNIIEYSIKKGELHG
jgi:hypothetical protein